MKRLSIFAVLVVFTALACTLVGAQDEGYEFDSPNFCSAGSEVTLEVGTVLTNSAGQTTRTTAQIEVTIVSASGNTATFRSQTYGLISFVCVGAEEGFGFDQNSMPVFPEQPEAICNAGLNDGTAHLDLTEDLNVHEVMTAMGVYVTEAGFGPDRTTTFGDAIRSTAGNRFVTDEGELDDSKFDAILFGFTIDPSQRLVEEDWADDDSMNVAILPDNVVWSGSHLAVDRVDFDVLDEITVQPNNATIQAMVAIIKSGQHEDIVRNLFEVVERNPQRYLANTGITFTSVDQMMTAKGTYSSTALAQMINNMIVDNGFTVWFLKDGPTYTVDQFYAVWAAIRSGTCTDGG